MRLIATAAAAAAIVVGLLGFAGGQLAVHAERSSEPQTVAALERSFTVASKLVDLAEAQQAELDVCRARTDDLRELLEVLIRVWPGWARLPDPPPTTGWPAWPEAASFRWDNVSLRDARAGDARQTPLAAQGDGPWSAAQWLSQDSPNEVRRLPTQNGAAIGFEHPFAHRSSPTSGATDEP